jgi:hypothetical protein
MKLISIAAVGRAPSTLPTPMDSRKTPVKTEKSRMLSPMMKIRADTTAN